MAEQGLPGFEAVLHYGIVAPAGTPRPIVDKLNAALRAALGDPKVHGHIATEGAEPLPTSRTNMPPTSTARKPSGQRC